MSQSLACILISFLNTSYFTQLICLNVDYNIMVTNKYLILSMNHSTKWIVVNNILLSVLLKTNFFRWNLNSRCRVLRRDQRALILRFKRNYLRLFRGVHFSRTLTTRKVRKISSQAKIRLITRNKSESSSISRMLNHRQLNHQAEKW